MNLYPKKLIEVALPLPEINDASAYDKMPGIGPHPKGIHHWWARLPLPCARAVLFASVVTDPSEDPAWKDKSDHEQDTERERLFGIVRRLMGKKLHQHPEVYAEANAEMLKHCGGRLPPVLDPFSGGGSIPLEAAIGPGMAVFSRYAAVLESTGQPMSVRKALHLINGIKDELLGEAMEDLDKDTRWAVQWFGEDRFNWGEAGKANLLANAQATAVNGLVTAGILEVEGNRVRLINPERLPADWNPKPDQRLTVWEMTHHLLRIYYYEKQGDAATAALLRRLGSKADVARDLAYKLFAVCEKHKWSAEAQAYNALALGWPELVKLAKEPLATRVPEQQEFAQS